MKTLYLMRHAKSSWDYPELSDHDRPLNGRGRQDAPLMGSQLLSREIKPDLVLSSTAVRALTTATLVAKEVDYDMDKLQTDEDIYHADKSGLLQIIREIPEEIDSLLFVAHNFAISELANMLAPESLADIPTAGVVALTFPVNSWADIEPEHCKVLFTDKPKNYHNKKDKDKDKEKDKSKSRKEKDRKAKQEEQKEE
jgi:phosphohistidine phosphatase